MSSIELLNLSNSKSTESQIFKKLFISSEFLKAIDSRVNDSDIRPSVAEPGEILFHDARFIVKELKVSSAYSPRNSISAITEHVLKRSVADLSEEYAVAEMSTTEVVQTVARKLDFLTRPHSVARRRNQDLLLRVELRNCRLLSSKKPLLLTVFQAMGWRSVSVIVDRLVIILYASDRAPVWIQSNKSQPFATRENR